MTVEQRLDTLIMMLADPNITINPSGMEKIKENLLAAARKEFLDKAVAWIRKYAHTYSFVNAAMTNEVMAEHFKKYMEEQQ